MHLSKNKVRAFTTTKATISRTICSNPEVLHFTDGYVDIPQGPGLGVEINEDYVIERSKEGHRWHNPLWQHPDGSIAEW